MLDNLYLHNNPQVEVSNIEAASAPSYCGAHQKFDAEHGTKLYDAYLETGFLRHDREHQAC